MDSGALLDLLGNENRRRILQLLSQKPCYVTEISDHIGVSPKAVIDHLKKLENAGLVESHTDDKRRKYFHISRNLRLEVNVSPYGFGMKSAYAASANLDLGGCHHLSISLDPEPEGEVAELADDLDRLRELERELSLAQRWVQGRIAAVQDELSDTVGEDNDGRLYAEVLAAMAGGADTPRAIAEEVSAPEEIVRQALAVLRDRELVGRAEDGSGWTITTPA